MPLEAEPVGGGAENVLEPRRGVAVGVQRTRESQDEPDGARIRVVGAPGERCVGQWTN
jgi:hypothetical protein